MMGISWLEFFNVQSTTFHLEATQFLWTWTVLGILSFVMLYDFVTTLWNRGSSIILCNEGKVPMLTVRIIYSIVYCVILLSSVDLCVIAFIPFQWKVIVHGTIPLFTPLMIFTYIDTSFLRDIEERLVRFGVIRVCYNH